MGRTIDGSEFLTEEKGEIEVRASVYCLVFCLRIEVTMSHNTVTMSLSLGGMDPHTVSQKVSSALI